jgi:aspartate/methionine/tyrosine aminotransferase
MMTTSQADQVRTPPALAAAALPGYAAVYGRSVLELDSELGAAPGPADLIDLTHGDTRAFVPPAAAAADFDAGLADNTEAYTPYRGSTRIRAALAPRLAGLLGRPVDPAREVILTPGTQGGLFAALSALVSPGDVVALPDPEYFMSERIVAYLGGIAHRLPVRQDQAGLLSIEPAALAGAAEAGARLLLLSHPNNPTGGVYAEETAQALAGLVTRADMLAVVDQLYCRLIFAGTRYVHLGALPGMAERTVTLVGPSKTESMSGYRVGAAVGPAAVIAAMERVESLASLRTAGYGQQALGHWMDGDADWLAERTAAHQELRDGLVARLGAIKGVEVTAPAGSSYVFPDATGAAGPDDHATAVALKAGGVLVSPGYQFGPAGRGRFRINFSQDAGRLALACDRIEAVLTNAGS